MTVDRLRSMPRATALVLLCAALGGCPDDPSPPVADSSTGEDTSSTTDPSIATTVDSTSSTSDGVDSTATDDPSTTGTDETTGEPPLPPIPCPEEWQCQEDQDGDGRPLSCDNARDHRNPDQGDMDYDSFGDVVDLCPTVQGLGNMADSDVDGVGNACDVCGRPPGEYSAGVPQGVFAVRNTPHQGDLDRDGVGDACDDCPTVPDCLDYGDGPGLTPWEPGLPLDLEDLGCQIDADVDGIGDACEGTMGPDAAGPVGFGDGDDFDQDGLTNALDGCPRLPVTRTECAGAGDCPGGSACDDGVCNHPDPDGDGVGSECDTCPFVPNPGQVIDGMMQTDDTDGDFVGDACEHPSCAGRRSPWTQAFYDVAVGGQCCTTRWQGRPLADPDGMPLGLGDLPELPPGLVELPPGCDEALAAAGVDEATALTPADVGGADALWAYLCFLPPWDQDYDGLGDECDLCPFAFDPTNAPYVSPTGMVFPNDGAYCNGEYSCDADE